MFRIVLSSVLFGCACMATVVAQASDAVVGPYAGQHSREIKSLSAEDIDDLQAGRGWGVAKPAELNGFPGPVHLLELKDDIALSDSQVREIQALFDDMKREAMVLGAAYVDAERALDRAFAAQDISPDALATLVARAADVKGRLRLVHLQTHLKTLPLLSKHQVVTYMRLRGYGGGGHRH